MQAQTPEREKIFTLYSKLIAGKRWKEIEQEAGISRQWFDKKRTEYGLPPPADVRRSKKNKETPPKERREQILERRKQEGFLTMEEAAESLGITVGVLAVQQRKGAIKGEKEGVNIFIHKNVIEDYKKSHRRHGLDSKNSLGYMTVKDAVNLSEKSIATIYADIQKGKLEAWKNGSTVLILKSSFEQWLANKEKKVSRGVDQQEIINAYRLLSEGATWEDLDLSKKITQKGFDKRRSALKLPAITKIRKQKEIALR